MLRLSFLGGGFGVNHLEAERYENAALRDQIKELKVMHLSAESELMMSEAHVERLTSENQYQANLLGNAYGAVADWSDLPSDTRPAKAIEHLGRRVERLTAELAEKNTLIERCMSMAHVTALFHGGRGEGDPYVGFREILQHNTELIEQNDQAEAREQALRDVLNEAFRTETVRDLHDWLQRAKGVK